MRLPGTGSAADAGRTANTRTAGSKGDTVGLVWAASSTAAAVRRYRVADLPQVGLHIPVPGVSSRAVMPPDNTAHIPKKQYLREPVPVAFSHKMRHD